MTEIILDETRFKNSISRIRSKIDNALIVYLGKNVESDDFTWNSAYFLFILGYEFPNTIMIIGSDKVMFITSHKKAKILKQLAFVKFNNGDKENNNNKDDDKSCNETNDSNDNDVIIIEKEKDNDDIPSIIKRIEETFGNEFVAAQIVENNLYNDLLKHFKLSNIENSNLFSEKTRPELENTLKSSDCSFYLLKKMINIIVENKERISSKQISEKIEEMLDLKIRDFPHDQRKVDFIYSPFVQSGDFELSKFPENPFSELFLKEKLTLVAMGMRYNYYSSEVARSLLINEYEMKEDYMTLFKTRDFIIEMINNDSVKNGILTNELVKKAKEYYKKTFKNNKSDELTLEIFSTGIMNKECVPEMINNNSSIVVNMILGSTKPLVLKDTIVIVDKVVNPPKDSPQEYIATVEFSRRRAQRNIKRIKETEKNIARNENQIELMSNLIEEMIEHYKMKPKADIKSEAGVEDEYFSYQRENLLMRTDRLAVDVKNKILLIPIYGYCVPFHIFYVKSISKIGDDMIKINFKENKVSEMRSLTYKAKKDYIDCIFNEISELRRAFINHEDMVVEQEDLKEIMGRKIVLSEVYMRTDGRAGKKKCSNLEIHENGFRFYDDSPVDILFKNVKHMIFQESGIEERAMIHISLVSPLIIGKNNSVSGKKTHNIQFYRDTGTIVAVDTSKVGRNEDYIERMLEQENELKRRETNEEFKKFIKRIEEVSSIRAEVPFREQGFYGVPHKERVFLMPTENLIMNIFEFPPTVIPLSEIEIVNFERVSIGVRTFDMVVVFKNKTFHVIQTIDYEYLEPLKDFLNQKNIVYIETAVNINWSNLLKVVLRDPINFYEQGGWADLQPNREDSEFESDTTASLESSTETSGDVEISTSDTYADSEDITPEVESEDDAESLVDSEDEEYSD
ncbi:FACT complex subunit SPT16 [Dictyocoela muelleri]|nr:FACT complex subunit SPT16 [Dictyocoela muelleri]